MHEGHQAITCQFRKVENDVDDRPILTAVTRSLGKIMDI
jgi:hypothetical protein